MKYLLIILTLFFYSCSSDSNSVTIPKEEYNKLKGDTLSPEYPKRLLKPEVSNDFYPKMDGLEIVLIDSCEYIIGSDKSTYNGGIYLTHRARCKFCEQRKNK